MPAPAGFRDLLSFTGFLLVDVPSTGPVIDSTNPVQRDTEQTFLVDVNFTFYDSTNTGQPATVAVAYSTVGPTGPWLPASAQPYDRHHTLGLGPTFQAQPPIPTASPGTPEDYVWQPFFDLGPVTDQLVWLQITVTNSINIDDVVVTGPITIDTTQPVVVSPLQAQLQRRAIGAASPTDFLGFGLSYPFYRGAQDFIAEGGPNLVRRCVNVILRTNAAASGPSGGPSFGGDLPWRPDFGQKLWLLKHRKNDDTLAAEAIAYIQEALVWEPRVQLVDVRVEPKTPDTTDQLTVHVTYQVITSNVGDNRVVLPTFTDSFDLT